MMAAHSVPADIMLSELLAGIADLRGSVDCPIKRISTDSRQVQAGDLFFALSGLRAQGHDFITHYVKIFNIGIIKHLTSPVPQIGL